MRLIIELALPPDMSEIDLGFQWLLLLQVSQLSSSRASGFFLVYLEGGSVASSSPLGRRHGGLHRFVLNKPAGWGAN